MLALDGVSVIGGNFLGGRVCDKKLVSALALMLGAQAAALLIFTFTAASMLGAIMVGLGLLLTLWSGWLDRRPAPVAAVLADGAEGH